MYTSIFNLFLSLLFSLWTCLLLLPTLNFSFLIHLLLSPDSLVLCFTLPVSLQVGVETTLPRLTSVPYGSAFLHLIYLVFLQVFSYLFSK